jgi:hypothetical protein
MGEGGSSYASENLITRGPPCQRLLDGATGSDEPQEALQRIRTPENAGLS